MAIAIQKEYASMVGVPTPVLINLPWLQYINARNLRAVFHRYCLAHNKGPLPPHTPWLQPSAPHPTPFGTPSTDDRGGGGSSSGSGGGSHSGKIRSRSGSGRGDSTSSGDVFQGGGSGGAGNGGGGGSSSGRRSGSGYYGLPPIHQSEEVDPWAFKHEQCCCMYRSLSVMEMQSFWALSTDIEVISDALRRPDCSFDQARLQSAFVTSASVAGVHCKDNSLGIHDHPLTKKLQPATAFGPPSSAVNDSTRRYTPASTFGSGQRVRGASRDLLNTYKPLFHMTLGANISGSTYRLPPGLSVSAPNAGFIKAGASLRSSFDLPRGPTPASPRQSPRSPFGLGRTPSAHRPAPMTLAFPQFVDALRLVAEEVVGHPQSTPLVELTLLRIVNDLLKVITSQKALQGLL
ncbi:MAG: hypothetical protein WDW38_010648 [Sanguina aurantia]